MSDGTPLDTFDDLPEPPNGLPASVAMELRTAATSVLLERMRFAKQVGVSFEGKRDMYSVLGYPRRISTTEYREQYARGGIAGSIVDVMPDATWRGEMWLEENDDPEIETPFEKAWSELDTKHQIQAKLLRVDKLSRLSTYATLLIGARGDLATELPRGNAQALLYLRPCLGGGSVGQGNSQIHTLADDTTVSVWEYDTNPASSRFGLPQSYRLRHVGATSAAEIQEKPVHWTRMIHIAEGLLEDDVYGMPALERVWNLLMDLEKVTGGGAEAYWLRANQGLQLDIDKDMALPDVKETIADLKLQADEYKHQLTRWLRTRGVEVKTLGSDVANFGPSADAIITQIAGAKRIPRRILTGSEMGELASSQDRENFKDQVVGRQKQYAGPYIVRQLVDRLIEYGYLPTPQKGIRAYEVMWPHVQTMTEEERMEGAKTWAAVVTPEGQVFTNAEIRDQWYDKQPLTDAEKAEIAPPEPEPEPGPEPEVEDEDDEAIVDRRRKQIEAPIAPAARVAEEHEDDADADLLRVLTSAIRAGDTETIDAIIGVDRTLGGPGSGNFGHAGRPGQVGGSAPASGASVGDWKSEGGWEHTGITWKQPTDPKTGRPVPIKVKTVEEAVERVLKGQVVEVEDARTAYTLVEKLSERVLEMRDKGEAAADFDLCQVTVKGGSMFCAESLRSKEYPNGVPRLDMPQLGGVPVPGSEADKLPRNPWDKTEVDGADKFISHLQGIGVKTERDVVSAVSLRASQRELVGSKVAKMIKDRSFDPAKNPIFVSSDNYVVDGHHRWAAVIGRDAEDGVFGDLKMNVIRVNAPISEVLHLANAWSKKFGIQQTAGVTKQAAQTGLTK